MALKARSIGFSLAGLAAVAALGWVAFRPVPLPVDLALVSQGPMAVTVNADGRTRIREVFEVSSPIAGTARRSPVAVGNLVIRGETVVAVVEPVAPPLLDSRSRVQAEAAVREAEAALRLAEAQARLADEELAHARGQHERVTTLVERKVASLTQLEDAVQLLSIRLASREAAVSGVAMAQSSLDRARALVATPVAAASNGPSGSGVSLKAPASGRVLAVANVSEHTVLPGAPLVSIGQPDDLEIVADLLSADAVRLPEGAAAAVERWGGPLALEARLIGVEPSAVTKVSALGIEEQRVDAVFDLLTPPEARRGLGDGFAVYLRIVVWQAEDAVQVPLSALFRQGEGWAVFAADQGEGVARLVPVVIGQRNHVSAEVLDGIAPGALVVTHPSDALTDGALIVAREAL